MTMVFRIWGAVGLVVFLIFLVMGSASTPHGGMLTSIAILLWIGGLLWIGLGVLIDKATEKAT
jgi:hypothetical protein